VDTSRGCTQTCREAKRPSRPAHITSQVMGQISLNVELEPHPQLVLIFLNSSHSVLITQHRPHSCTTMSLTPARNRPLSNNPFVNFPDRGNRFDSPQRNDPFRSSIGERKNPFFPALVENTNPFDKNPFSMYL